MDYDSDGALANVPPPTLPPIWITIGLSRASFFIFFGRLFVYAFMSGCCHCIGLQVRYMSVYSTIHHQWLQKREENIKNIGGDQTSGRQVKGTGKRPNSEHGRPRTQKEQARDPKKNAEGWEQRERVQTGWERVRWVLEDSIAVVICSSIRLSTPAIRIIRPTNDMLIRLPIQVFRVPGHIHHTRKDLRPRECVGVRFLSQVHTFGEYAILIFVFSVLALLTTNLIEFLVQILNLYRW